MSRYKISRQRIVEALELLGLPPSACMNVLMEPDKVTVEMTVQGVETGRVAWKNPDSSEWAVLTADVVFYIVEDYPTGLVDENDEYEATEMRAYNVKPRHLLDYKPGDRVYDPGNLPEPPAQVPLTPEEEEWIGPLIPEEAVPEDLPDPDYWDVSESTIPWRWPPGYEPQDEHEASCFECRFEAWEAFYLTQGKRAESDSKPPESWG